MNKKRQSRNHFFARKAQAEAQTAVATPEPSREKGHTRYQKADSKAGIGVRGLKHRTGIIYDEWKQEFRTWSRAVKQYLEMRDYYVIATMLDAVKLPLLKAPFATEPAVAKTPGDLAAAEWLHTAMQRMHRQTWASHAEDMLSCIEFGWSVSEIVLEKREDGRFWPRNIDPRGQDTLERWTFDLDVRDEVTEMVQRDPNTNELIQIPLSKCVHTTFRGRKGNPEGHSILMSLHWPYRMLKDFEIFEGIGIERDVGGMPVAELPEGNISDQDEDDLEEALKGMRRDENEYLITPPGVKINPYGSSSKMYDIGAVIERKKKEILMRMFAQFLMLGMEQVGTQALVRGSQDFFNLAIGAIQESVVQAWNQQLVPYLFSFNYFEGMTEYPQIVWMPPGKVDIGSLMATLNQAAGAKIFTPTDIDEDHLRELISWPELPDEERGQPRDAEMPPTPGIFDIKGKANVPVR